MELDELRNRWLSLDERLKKQEILKESIMREILHTKSDKALSRLISFEIFGIIILIFIIPVVVFAVKLHPNIPGYTAFMYTVLAAVAAVLVWLFFKLYGLSRINFSKPVSVNIRYINKYNIWIKKEKLFTIILVLLLGSGCAYFYARLNADFILWVCMTCLFLGLSVLSIWSYKKIYIKNISSIQKSLDELRDLKEE
ncbi:hypothetical protein LJC00_01180 [Dysgonomonas sp. OttesenSCG-928-M03]|nr:hypothetical protein [Dysgonomonas sp. OttesenSCG-928-M03]